MPIEGAVAGIQRTWLSKYLVLHQIQIHVSNILYFISLKCFSRLHGITTSAFGGLAGSLVDKSFNEVVQTISVDCYLFNWKPSICHIFDGCADILYKDQTSDLIMFPVEVFVLESVCGWVPLTEWVDQVGGWEPAHTRSRK